MKYFVNFRTEAGENPAFVEITAEAFAALANARNVLMTPRGFAIYHGRGKITGEAVRLGDDEAEWLQYLDVPVKALIPSDPLDQDAPMTVVEMTEQDATPDPVDPPEPNPIAPYVSISLDTVKWWRDLVDLNPADLAPRMDSFLRANGAIE